MPTHMNSLSPTGASGNVLIPTQPFSAVVSGSRSWDTSQGLRSELGQEPLEQLLSGVNSLRV